MTLTAYHCSKDLGTYRNTSTNFWAEAAKYPNFKKKHHGGSAEVTKSTFKWQDGQVWLAKCTEPLPICWSRQLHPQHYNSQIGCEWAFSRILFVDTVIELLPKIDFVAHHTSSGFISSYCLCE